METIQNRLDLDFEPLISSGAIPTRYPNRGLLPAVQRIAGVCADSAPDRIQRVMLSSATISTTSSATISTTGSATISTTGTIGSRRQFAALTVGWLRRER